MGLGVRRPQAAVTFIAVTVVIGAAFGIGFILGPALGGVLGNISPRLPFWGADIRNLGADHSDCGAYDTAVAAGPDRSRSSTL